MASIAEMLQAKEESRKATPKPRPSGQVVENALVLRNYAAEERRAARERWLQEEEARQEYLQDWAEADRENLKLEVEKRLRIYAVQDFFSDLAFLTRDWPRMVAEQREANRRRLVAERDSWLGRALMAGKVATASKAKQLEAAKARGEFEQRVVALRALA